MINYYASAERQALFLSDNIKLFRLIKPPKTAKILIMLKKWSQNTNRNYKFMLLTINFNDIILLRNNKM